MGTDVAKIKASIINRLHTSNLSYEHLMLLASLLEQFELDAKLIRDNAVLQSNNNQWLSAVTIKKLAELSGYSEGALRKKIHDNIFQRDVHYKKSPDGRIQIKIQQYNLWLVNNESWRLNNCPSNTLFAITKKKLSELTGYSESALGNKVHDGVFREGFHYIRSPDNRLQFIISNIENYLSGER